MLQERRFAVCWFKRQRKVKGRTAFDTATKVMGELRGALRPERPQTHFGVLCSVWTGETVQGLRFWVYRAASEFEEIQ